MTKMSHCQRTTLLLQKLQVLQDSSRWQAQRSAYALWTLEPLALAC